MDKDSIIEIFSGTLWESEMIKTLLESADIQSFLKNAVLNSYAYEPIKSEGVQVMISVSDIDRAKEIIDNYYNNMKPSC